MRKIIFLLVAFLPFVQVNSQILDPVKWTTKIEKKTETNYILTFNGVIENDWHLYSQFTPDGGPLPLEVIFKNQKGQGIMEYVTAPLVSCDFRGNPHSTSVDSAYTKMMDNDFLKVLAWYDNEWGYSNRCVDLLHYMASKGL